MPSWLKQIISYIVSFSIYTALINWRVALILTGGIAFHECGHLYAAKSVGMKTGGFYLIPFLGGVSLITSKYETLAHKAFVVMAGPIAGGVLTIICYIAYLFTGWDMLISAAYWMAIMNLFNLVPVGTMDGGQLVDAVLSSINELTAAIFLTISYLFGSIFIFHLNPIISGLLVFTGVPHVLSKWNQYKMRKEGWGNYLPQQPDKMSTMTVVLTSIVYIGSAIGLYLLMGLYGAHTDGISSLFGK